jgi:molybdopterin-binding protein
MWKWTWKVAPGSEAMSIITKKSAENPGLAVGKETYAVVKASNIIIGVEE